MCFGVAEKDHNLIDYEIIKFDAQRRLYLNIETLKTYFEHSDEYALDEIIEEEHSSTTTITKLNSTETLKRLQQIVFDSMVTAMNTGGLTKDEKYIELLDRAHRNSSQRLKPFLKYIIEVAKHRPFYMVDDVIKSTEGSSSEMRAYLERLKFKNIPANNPSKKLIEQYFVIGKRQYSN